MRIHAQTAFGASHNPFRARLAGLSIAGATQRTYFASMQMPVKHVAIIGLGLIGSSIARAARKFLPALRLSAFDSDEVVRRSAAELQLVDFVAHRPEDAVAGADLVILCVPVQSIKVAAQSIAQHLNPEALVSDVGSSKQLVSSLLREALPRAKIIPAHPVAGKESSGPEAGTCDLFINRWCIVTPDAEASTDDVEKLSTFWETLGARVELMSAADHDLVLAVISHVPHLIAFAMIGTAADLERATESEIIKYSGGGFRDFTRIAAANPIMWRDIFLTNKDAVLDVLQRFNLDLEHLKRAIEQDDADVLLDLFTQARAVRQRLVE